MSRRYLFIGGPLNGQALETHDRPTVHAAKQLEPAREWAGLSEGTLAFVDDLATYHSVTIYHEGKTMPAYLDAEADRGDPMVIMGALWEFFTRTVS